MPWRETGKTIDKQENSGIGVASEPEDTKWWIRLFNIDFLQILDFLQRVTESVTISKNDERRSQTGRVMVEIH